MSATHDDSEPTADYDVPFVWQSSHGHMVELLVEHVPPGVVVDVGCGYAPHAEQLAEAGFELIGLDLDQAAVDHLRARGFTSAVGDLGDPSALVSTIEQITADCEVRALLAMDVLEHLAAPHETLAALVEWMGDRAVDVLGISLPNVSHQDVAAKLLAGRWDLTPTGLLDHTHLRWFTDRSVDVLTGSVGVVELARNDVKSEKSDQYWPATHPLVSHASQLGLFARGVRGRADGHGDTFQFVRLYRRSDQAVSGPTLLDDQSPTEAGAVGVSVVAVGDMGTRAGLVAALAGQTSDDFEVVTGDEPLDLLVGRCMGQLVVVVDHDESFGDRYVEQFLVAAERYPGAVLRCGAQVGDRELGASGGFDLMAHLLQNSTPPATIAYPRLVLTELGLRFDPADPDRGWYSLLVEAATLVGVASTGAVAVSVPSDWLVASATSAGEHAAEVRRRLDRLPWLMPAGGAEHLAALTQQRQQSEARIEQLEARAEALAADNEWLNSELGVTPVRLLRRLLRRNRSAVPQR